MFSIVSTIFYEETVEHFSKNCKQEKFQLLEVSKMKSNRFRNNQLRLQCRAKFNTAKNKRKTVKLGKFQTTAGEIQKKLGSPLSPSLQSKDK